MSSGVNRTQVATESTTGYYLTYRRLRRRTPLEQLQHSPLPPEKRPLRQTKTPTT